MEQLRHKNQQLEEERKKQEVEVEQLREKLLLAEERQQLAEEERLEEPGTGTGTLLLFTTKRSS